MKQNTPEIMTMYIIKSLKISLLVAMLLTTVVFTSCSGSEENTVTPSKGEATTITVDRPAVTTQKVAFNDGQVGSSDGDALTWQTDDKLIVVGFDGTTYKGQAEFTLTAGAGTTSALFSGTDISGATSYNVYVKVSDLNISTSDGSATFTLSAQTQTGFGTTNHLREHLYLYKEDIASTSLTSPFTLTMGNAIMKFVLTNIPTALGDLRTLRWKASQASKSALYYGGESYYMSTTYSSFLYFPENTISFSSTVDSITAYMVFDTERMELPAKGRFAVTLVNSSGTEYMARVFSTSGQSYTTANRYTAALDGTTYAWNLIPDSLVDMGLSLEWATHNIGAKTAGLYGGYFQWSATTPGNYNNTNPSRRQSSIVGNSTLDAARVLWGSSWRLPTAPEMTELRNNVSVTTATQDGNAGILLTSTVEGYTDKSIFIPFAGYHNGTDFTQVGTEMWMWSADPVNATQARRFRYLSSSGTLNYPAATGEYLSLKYFSMPLRPVWK